MANKSVPEIKKKKIDGVIIIGGNSSFAGANIFISEFNIPFIGIPKTIDNDIYGTDFSIGFDTSINTALDAIDKIRDTANSHHRLFFVEVNPSCFDRVLATRLGHEAVKAMLEGKKNVIAGIKNNKLTYTDFSKASSGKHSINKSLLIMASELSS